MMHRPPMHRPPRPRSLLLAAIVALASASGCIDSSQQPLDYEAVAIARGDGKSGSASTAMLGEWSVTLTRADVALGPFYFCAAASGSSTLCASSIAEVAHVSVVNALAATRSPIGTVHGFSGTIQSVSYDFGISWFDTQIAATPAPALPSGHSLRLEGEARKGAARVPFTADVDVVPQYQGQNALSTASANAVIDSSATRLEVVLDPVRWLAQLDFDALASKLAASGAPSFAIAPGMPEHGAILVGLKNLAPLQFRWVPAGEPR